VVTFLVIVIVYLLAMTAGMGWAAHQNAKDAAAAEAKRKRAETSIDLFRTAMREEYKMRRAAWKERDAAQELARQRALELDISVQQECKLAGELLTLRHKLKMLAEVGDGVGAYADDTMPLGAPPCEFEGCGSGTDVPDAKPDPQECWEIFVMFPAEQ